MVVSSHTLVKNGQPFIGPVIRQVIPFMNTCRITVSVKADEKTLYDISMLAQEFPGKVIVDTENVASPKLLTQERQKQLRESSEDWILFLDDDDWWPEESLKEMMVLLEKDVDGYASNPYQLLSKTTHDNYWKNRHFTKWFRNGSDVHYSRPWPRDLIFKGSTQLYWKINPRVPRIPVKFFHLSNIKASSFRKEDWAKKYNDIKAQPVELPEKWKEEVSAIYKYLS
jgi:hypothetical protein